MKKKTFTEKQLKDAIQEPDDPPSRQVLNYVYKQLFPPIRGFVTQYGGTSNDATDVLHLTIEKAQQKLLENKYDDRGNILSYCYGIARYIWLNKAKSEAKRRSTIESFEDYHQDIAVKEEEEPTDNLQLRVLAMALNSMKNRGHVDLLKKFYYENKKIKDLAQIYGINENAVKARLFNARKGLKREMNKYLKK